MDASAVFEVEVAERASGKFLHELQFHRTSIVRLPLLQPTDGCATGLPNKSIDGDRYGPTTHLAAAYVGGVGFGKGPYVSSSHLSMSSARRTLSILWLLMNMAKKAVSPLSVRRRQATQSPG